MLFLGAPGNFGRPGIEGRKGEQAEPGIPGRPGRQVAMLLFSTLGPQADYYSNGRCKQFSLKVQNIEFF